VAVDGEFDHGHTASSQHTHDLVAHRRLMLRRLLTGEKPASRLSFPFPLAPANP
jgi:hypothetical protein